MFIPCNPINSQAVEYSLHKWTIILIQSYWRHWFNLIILPIKYYLSLNINIILPILRWLAYELNTDTIRIKWDTHYPMNPILFHPTQPCGPFLTLWWFYKFLDCSMAIILEGAVHCSLPMAITRSARLILQVDNELRPHCRHSPEGMAGTAKFFFEDLLFLAAAFQCGPTSEPLNSVH